MAIKTISLEVDAYDILCRARQHPRESFSRVVRRAHWSDPQHLGATVFAFMRARMQRGSALSDASLDRLGKIAEYNPSSKRPTKPHAPGADAYMADISYLATLEGEVARRVEGPAMAYLLAHPAAVIRVCVITIGEYMAGMQKTDIEVGHQVMAQFDSVILSSVIAQRYAAEYARTAALPSEELRIDNDLWVGCAAVESGIPLLTWRANRYTGINGLQIVAF